MLVRRANGVGPAMAVREMQGLMYPWRARKAQKHPMWLLDNERRGAIPTRTIHPGRPGGRHRIRAGSRSDGRGVGIAVQPYGCVRRMGSFSRGGA